MLVVGPTGYIGKFVVKELVKRGYNVVAFAREQAGIKGKMSKEDTVKVGARTGPLGGRGQGWGGRAELPRVGDSAPSGKRAHLQGKAGHLACP